MTAGVLGGQQHSCICPLAQLRDTQAPSASSQLRRPVYQRQQLPARASDSLHLQQGLSIFQQKAHQQTFPRSRRRVIAPAAISADAGIPVVASQQAGAEPVQSRGLGSLTSRILSGSVLGLAGGLIILAGGWVFTVATCLVAYQATQEFYGFITSKVDPWTARSHASQFAVRPACAGTVIGIPHGVNHLTCLTASCVMPRRSNMCI